MTTTPQAALLSDDEWLEYLLKHADAATLSVAAEKGQSIQTMGRWVLRMDANNLRKLAETAILAKLQATQEPVQAGELLPLPEPAHRGPTGTGTYFNSFTSDQMQAYARAALSARKPLTEDQVWHSDKIMSANGIAGFKMDALMRIVRAVEAHHGIGMEVKP